MLWVLICFTKPKVPCTAPSSHQLYDLLWAEVSKWRGQMLRGLRDTLEQKKDRIENVLHRAEWFAAARTARPENSEALQGFHAPTVLVVIDEASGVVPIIFDVLEGSQTGRKDAGENVMFLIIGNPTQTSGPFYDSHHSDRARWFTMRVMAEPAWDGTPLGEGVFLSPRVSQEYCDSMAKRYGKDSNVFRVRVLGLFPKSEDDVVIPLEWVEAAAMRDLHRKQRASISIGVDVARFGSDDSAIVVREGRNIIKASRKHGNDTAKTAGWVINEATRLEREKLRDEDGRMYDERERIYIFVDSIGVGAGVVDMIRAAAVDGQKPWIVVDVNAAERSSDPDCDRKRDEMWWKAREFFRTQEPAISGKIDREDREQLMAELSSPKYDFTIAGGRVKVESKDHMKDRGLASPNLADALIHTFSFEVQKPAPVKQDGWRDRYETPEDDWTVV